MKRPRIVIVGAGFAGFHAAKTLCRLARGRADIVVVNSTDYFLYVPLLPEVATGILEPRRLTVSIADTLPEVRLVLGEVDGLDLDHRKVRYADPVGRRDEIRYDRLIIAAGSVNKLLPIPGVTEYAHGFRGIPEAVFLRDHLTQQIELADASDDPAERNALCTFVVVGAGYTGTEVAAHGVLYTELLKKRRPRLKHQRMRWMLLDIADRVLPELDERLSRTADKVLRERGVDVQMGTSVEEAKHDGVRLTDKSFVPTHSLIWCVGVRPDPMVDGLGLKTEKGRLVVDEYLNVPDHPDVFACGDAAAVPDLTRLGEVTPMTAQHAERQGKRAAKNVAASFGTGERKPYVHKDLGFVVDLGGTQAAANPLQVPLAGLPAKAVTRGYHLLSMPGNRIRTATEWAFDAVLRRQTTQLGVIPGEDVPLETASPERTRKH
ncbi:NADH dehydrogenase [Kribbella antiqua]|uniref:NADH dehydrogenase n=1 Tax=Kribbella antiqua TaxID=2512217 RepID=A0A4R2I6Y0_9ACTN|nr:NAD(P)/FAD-dependent oxidoreductase [Kribbella antiqua]TCO40091.1 NADH dehydrogenase [Kribbella antiqua]